MSHKLYVGGLAYATTDNDLQSLFSQQGNVLSANVITDRDTGRSKGFGFVEMSSSQEAQDAIKQFNGTQVGGRTITVNEAKERAPRSQSGSRW